MEHNKRIIGNVFETNDYDYFKPNFLNREVREPKIVRMMTSFSTYGQQMPVLIDHEGNLIDGAHRVEVCKRLGLPVKYIETNYNDDDLIQQINDHQTSWSIQDHIEYFAKRGNEHYQLSISLGELYGIRPGTIAGALGKTTLNTKEIKQGNLKLHDKSLLIDFLEFHSRFYFLSSRKHAYFIQALFEVWNNPATDEQRLYKQIVKNKDLFEFSVPKTEFVKRMKEVYNQNLKKESSRI